MAKCRRKGEGLGAGRWTRRKRKRGKGKAAQRVNRKEKKRKSMHHAIPRRVKIAFWSISVGECFRIGFVTLPRLFLRVSRCPPAEYVLVKITFDGMTEKNYLPMAGTRSVSPSSHSRSFTFLGILQEEEAESGVGLSKYGNPRMLVNQPGNTEQVDRAAGKQQINQLNEWQEKRKTKKRFPASIFSLRPPIPEHRRSQ